MVSDFWEQVNKKRRAGYTSVGWHVQDQVGNVQGGHASEQGAISHADKFPGKLVAMRTTIKVEPISTPLACDVDERDPNAKP